MNKATYDRIIEKLYDIPTNEKKCEYLLSVIERTDFDEESWNDELIELYNKYNRAQG